uniref:CYTH domain-containing protein n=1 Tax=viral metagenome TaxID=1070528 RepID=A0A6C0ELB4_9ZZZZ
MKYELRFLDIDETIIKKTLDLLDEHIVKQKVLLRWDSFNYKDKFIRLRDEGNGDITLTLKTNLTEHEPISKTIYVDNYFLTLDILGGVDIISKYRVEKIRETWELSNKCIINFDMFPGLPYYIEIKSNNKKTMLQLVKKLGLTIDTRKHSDMGADTQYYELYGIRKNRGPLGDLTFKDATHIFMEHIQKNKPLFEKLVREQFKTIELLDR